MIFLCRDFLTLPSSSVAGTNMYVMSIFMRHVLGFTTVGQVNFDLESNELVSALSASINQGLGSEYDVAIPSSSYLLSGSDVNRILSLRSSEYPRHNAGLFRITAVNTSSNVATIDYRSNEFPPVDPDVPFAIYNSEASLTFLSGSDGEEGYNSSGNATASRIILRSPEALSSWQVRLCLESDVDTIGAAVTPLSIAPGFKGNVNGDFFEVPEHLHGAFFHDSTSSIHRGLTVGTGLSSSFGTDQWRINFIGDSEKGTVGYMLRSGSTTLTMWGCFGLTDDEPEDDILARFTEEEHIVRLFTIGGAQSNPEASWRFDYQDRGVMNGVAWGNVTDEPVPCQATTYFPVAFTTQFSQTTELHSQPNAADNPWTGGTDLMDSEILVGIFDNGHNHGDNTLLDFQPRRLGRLPFFRHGRANYGDWVGGLGGHFPSSSWIHSTNGVYMEWGGPFPTDMTTGSNIVLLEATHRSASTGLLMLSPTDPGDSIEETVIPQGKDIDSVRFRKTYSYFRQEPRLVDFEKQGSNPQGGSKDQH